MSEILQIDVPILLVLSLSSVLCAVLGNLLILQNRAMTGDSLSHAVLPGLALAYMVTSSLHPLAMLAGAFCASLFAVGCIAVLQRQFKIDAGASMGIVLTSFFALGIFLLETQIGSGVHLDAHHALYGALELIYWPDLKWSTLPADISALFILLCITIITLGLFYFKIKVMLFDASFSVLRGVKQARLEIMTLILITAAIVFSFKALGVVLVLAFLTCPAATARCFCSTLEDQIKWSVIIALFNTATGYTLAAFVPLWMGFEHSLNSGGAIATFSGVVLLIVLLKSKTKTLRIRQI